jgi:hypothetical protein
MTAGTLTRVPWRPWQKPRAQGWLPEQAWPLKNQWLNKWSKLSPFSHLKADQVKMEIPILSS